MSETKISRRRFSGLAGMALVASCLVRGSQVAIAFDYTNVAIPFGLTWAELAKTDHRAKISNLAMIEMPVVETGYGRYFPDFLPNGGPMDQLSIDFNNNKNLRSLNPEDLHTIAMAYAPDDAVSLLPDEFLAPRFKDSKNVATHIVRIQSDSLGKIFQEYDLRAMDIPESMWTDRKEKLQSYKFNSTLRKYVLNGDIVVIMKVGRSKVNLPAETPVYLSELEIRFGPAKLPDGTLI